MSPLAKVGWRLQVGLDIRKFGLKRLLGPNAGLPTPLRTVMNERKVDRGGADEQRRLEPSDGHC